MHSRTVDIPTGVGAQRPQHPDLRRGSRYCGPSNPT
jgi:hypothetical protein